MALADTGGAAGMVATLVSLCGALMSQEELRLTIGPALGLGTGYTVWHSCCQTGRRSNRC